MSDSDSIMLQTIARYGALATDLLGYRDLADGTGRWLEIWPLTYGRCTLQLVRESDGLEPFGCPTEVIDQWEYAHPAYARHAMKQWDGSEGTEPSGWSRHPGTHRRRPGGQAEFEYVRE